MAALDHDYWDVDALAVNILLRGGDLVVSHRLATACDGDHSSRSQADRRLRPRIHDPPRALNLGQGAEDLLLSYLKVCYRLLTHFFAPLHPG